MNQNYTIHNKLTKDCILFLRFSLPASKSQLANWRKRVSSEGNFSLILGITEAIAMMLAAITSAGGNNLSCVMVFNYQQLLPYL